MKVGGHNKGHITTPDNPGKSPHMRWIRDALTYPHEDICLLWPFPGKNNGYGTIVREGKKLYVHRYICELIHGPAPGDGYQAAHSCNRGHEGCANPHHVRWKTRSENQIEATPHSKRKLTPDQVREIKSLVGLEHWNVTADRFGVSEATIRDIQAGRLWKSGTGRGRPFRDAEVQRIRSLEGIKPAAEVADEYSVSRGVVYNIWRRSTWTHVPEVSVTRG